MTAAGSISPAEVRARPRPWWHLANPQRFLRLHRLDRHPPMPPLPCCALRAHRQPALLAGLAGLRHGRSELVRRRQDQARRHRPVQVCQLGQGDKAEPGATAMAIEHVSVTLRQGHLSASSPIRRRRQPRWNWRRRCHPPNSPPRADGLFDGDARLMTKIGQHRVKGRGRV